MSYIRLTGQRQELPLSGGKSVTLHRIQALRDFHLTSASVKKGDIGGWVEDITTIQDGSWVADEAMIYEGSTVAGRSLVAGTSTVYGSTVRDGSIVMGDSTIHESELVGTSIISAFTTRSNVSHTRIDAGADIWDSVISMSLVKERIYAASSTVVDAVLAFHVTDAHIEKSQHTFMVEPMGSEESRVVLYRTKGENGHAHTLRIGCWTGTVEELMDEVVSRRVLYWNHNSGLTEANMDLMVKQYEALKVLLDTIIEGW